MNKRLFLAIVGLALIVPKLLVPDTMRPAPDIPKISTNQERVKISMVEDWPIYYFR